MTVDLDAVAENYATLVRQARGAEVAPVVKADGYGLGAAPIARRLMAEGARTFFVARIAEGVALREALGPTPLIYVLDGCPPSAGRVLKAANLSPVINSLEQAEVWAAEAGGPAALMLETGLNRLGLTAEETSKLGHGPWSLVMSHLACADQPGHPMNQAQRTRFEALAEHFPGARRSLAASDGLFLGPEFAFDLVRTGICLYGGGPQGRPDPHIRPVATFEAPILQLRTIPPGETSGYGAAWTATRTTRAAVVAAGYADGVLRASSPRAYGSLAGRAAPVIGRISMDLTIFDVTHIPEARTGALMQLVGPDVPIDDAAAAAGTIAYELLTRLGARAERRYLGRPA